MINYIQGNLFTSNAKVLVNTVNTVGVMGKGIAADFKKIYPKMFDEYKKLCDDNSFDIGDLYLYKTSNKWILNFPTKKHWKNPSTVEYIEKGLKRLLEESAKLQITDIAMPKLGCGNGGLDWETEVKPVVEKYLKKAPINVSIYDFDKDIIPEHLKQKDIEEWLKSDADNLTFSIFLEDLKEFYTNSLLPKSILLNGINYEVVYDIENEAFYMCNTSMKMVIAKEDLKTLFYVLKTTGKLCKENLYNELQEYSNEILDFISHLSYIVKNDNKIVLNYTKQLINAEVFDFE
ncbi:MAG: macro domain-containing protein [Campylobacterota bacterium]